ncbi:MAG: ABC transporter ATP-binding protein [Coriobacteriales bacterium]|jgi:iron complex transport system ATP-binding protein|nr:ABC transporter ATP-binding protein [Coriobacteriales bacterium]
MATLRVEDYCCGYGKRSVVAGIDFELSSGQTLCLLGPNGAGKTTLFKTMLGLLAPLGGRMAYDGEDTSGWGRRRFAQAFAYIPQDHSPAFPFSALEVVLMGRTPQMGTLQSPTKRDEDAAMQVMVSLGVEELATRDYTQLSGGERQMVLIARALAQEPAFLVMDEPTASLDFGNQARVLSLIRSLAATTTASLGIIMTTHDPNQAFLLGGRVACMGRDGSFVLGDAREIITPELLNSLYGTEVAFATATTSAGTAIPLCAPLLGDI